MGVLTYYFAENCMKMKEFGSQGVRSWRLPAGSANGEGASLAPPLDPPMSKPLVEDVDPNRSTRHRIYKHKF